MQGNDICISVLTVLSFVVIQVQGAPTVACPDVGNPLCYWKIGKRNVARETPICDPRTNRLCYWRIASGKRQITSDAEKAKRNMFDCKGSYVNKNPLCRWRLGRSLQAEKKHEYTSHIKKVNKRQTPGCNPHSSKMCLFRMGKRAVDNENNWKWLDNVDDNEEDNSGLSPEVLLEPSMAE